MGLGARTVGDLAAGTSAAQPALDAAVTAALSANTAAIVAHTAAAVANTTATSVEAAATVTNVGALFSNTAALVATGSVILGTFAPAAAAFAVDSSILFGAVVEDAAATTADAAATAADTGAILGDTAATIADTGATFSDLVAESANTAGLLVEATASGADAAASTADAAAATSDAAAEVANTAALTAASAASVAGGAAGAAGGAAGGLGGLLGGLGSIVNVVSGVVSAISSIVSNFQMAHLEKLTGEIEVTTRGMLNVLAVNGEDSILGATIHTWQELVTMGDELGQLHSDNVDIMGKFDDLLAAVEAGGGGSGGGGGGGGGALSAGDLLAINSVTSALSSLAVTINSQQYSNGGGVNPATFAPFSAGGTATQAYTLNAAVSNNPNGFSAIANPLNLAASAPSAIPGLGGLPGDQVFNAVNESGAALGVSTGALKWGGGLNGPMTGDWNLEAINGGAWAPGQESPALIAWAQANFATPPGGWIQYFDQAATLSPQQQYLNSYNKAALPQTGPTPSYLVPSTPVNSVGSHSLTVNALDPSAKGVGDALIQYLRSNGMKV